jgi:O-antigen ligase
MTLSSPGQKRLYDLIFLLWLVFFATIIFSWRAVTNISIAALLLSGFVLNKWETGKLINKRLFNIFTLACLVFFLVQFTGLVFTENFQQQWGNIRLKSTLVFIPLMVSCSNFINTKTRWKLMLGYCVLVFAAALYCLVAVLVAYSSHPRTELFFYFELVKPLSQHAIQFSVLVLIALIFLFESLGKEKIVFSKYLHYFFLVFFSIFLFLLSSKLMIAFFLIYLFYFIILYIQDRSKSRKTLIICLAVLVPLLAILFLTNNPVSKRFNEIVTGDVEFARREKFTPGDYFNGLQFRLLQWRLVPEILNENKAWLAGVSSGDAQPKLNQKYIEKNMYIGEDYRGDRGFLGYNSHNQLLTSLLQNGMIGVAAFLFVCFSLLKIARDKKERMLSFVVLLTVLFGLSESAFESQYSILIFVFFPLFFYPGKPLTAE